jgi:hypothetical protein
MDMKSKSTNTPHKLRANQKEAAVKTVKHDANFKQSRDMRKTGASVKARL